MNSPLTVFLPRDKKYLMTSIEDSRLFIANAISSGIFNNRENALLFGRMLTLLAELERGVTMATIQAKLQAKQASQPAQREPPAKTVKMFRKMMKDGKKRFAENQQKLQAEARS